MSKIIKISRYEYIPDVITLIKGFHISFLIKVDYACFGVVPYKILG